MLSKLLQSLSEGSEAFFHERARSGFSNFKNSQKTRNEECQQESPQKQPPQQGASNTDRSYPSPP